MPKLSAHNLLVNFVLFSTSIPFHSSYLPMFLFFEEWINSFLGQKNLKGTQQRQMPKNWCKRRQSSCCFALALKSLNNSFQVWQQRRNSWLWWWWWLPATYNFQRNLFLFLRYSKFEDCFLFYFSNWFEIWDYNIQTTKDYYLTSLCPSIATLPNGEVNMVALNSF